jgi:hypothetical protein
MRNERPPGWCSVVGLDTSRMRRSISRCRARHERAPLLACLAILIFCSSGCAIFGGYSSGPLASVTVWNQPQEKVEDATTAAFVMDGYQTVRADPGQITFQRPASTEDNVAYGSLFFKRSVTERVIVSIRPRGDGSTVVSCTASLVENPGDWLGEDSHKIAKNRREPYERLLNTVRARLL